MTPDYRHIIRNSNAYMGKSNEQGYNGSGTDVSAVNDSARPDPHRGWHRRRCLPKATRRLAPSPSTGAMAATRSLTVNNPANTTATVNSNISGTTRTNTPDGVSRDTTTRAQRAADRGAGPQRGWFRDLSWLCFGWHFCGRLRHHAAAPASWTRAAKPGLIAGPSPVTVSRQLRSRACVHAQTYGARCRTSARSIGRLGQPLPSRHRGGSTLGRAVRHLYVGVDPGDRRPRRRREGLPQLQRNPAEV